MPKKGISLLYYKMTTKTFLLLRAEYPLDFLIFFWCSLSIIISILLYKILKKLNRMSVTIIRGNLLIITSIFTGSALSLILTMIFMYF